MKLFTMNATSILILLIVISTISSSLACYYEQHSNQAIYMAKPMVLEGISAKQCKRKCRNNHMQCMSYSYDHEERVCTMTHKSYAGKTIRHVNSTWFQIGPHNNLWRFCCISGIKFRIFLCADSTLQEMLFLC